MGRFGLERSWRTVLESKGRPDATHAARPQELRLVSSPSPFFLERFLTYLFYLNSYLNRLEPRWWFISYREW